MTQSKDFQNLPYDPTQLPRELKPFYISASEEDIELMLKNIDTRTLDQLFDSIDSNVRFDKQKFLASMPQPLDYSSLIEHMQNLSKKNNLKSSFLGDGLKHYSVDPIVEYVCSLRGLTTAYTPYQPERSQGTLYTLWLYANAISQLTGFEAINASLYDRSTCLHEALNTAVRINKKSTTCLVSHGIHPHDKEVLETLIKETPLKIEYIPLDPATGLTDINWLNKRLEDETSPVAGVAFCQMNHLGLLENVHQLTDLCWQHTIQSIAIIDPLLLAGKNGLCPPAEYGGQKQGAHMIVGEGQHLALAPNFGGPGLGIFGIRHNQNEKLAIRSTAGRYVGKAKDKKGREALCMVLSTREQHIRREKATSNICSNQSFVATIAGAALLARGDEGLEKMHTRARQKAVHFIEQLATREGLELLYPHSPRYNEVAVNITSNTITASELIDQAAQEGIHIGVDLGQRLAGESHQESLLISFFDFHDEKKLEELENFLDSYFPRTATKSSSSYQEQLPQELLRHTPSKLPAIEREKLKKYYYQLSRLNLSPDDNIYPLGSCTMKYNPYVNDYAAGLEGFTQTHPQAPEADVQGSLEVLYEIQELFKSITGLPAVTTQPVAGAQGELVGVKMFQAYHRDRGEAQQRNLILIPRSAHGTNPATATMAGLETKKVDGIQQGIVTIEATSEGLINLDQLKEILAKDGSRVAGIMVTNPNTAGILESNFKEMAELIHQHGGLVYMDGANMNAIAGYLDLHKLGVDAVHNNLHKTWTVPHGGGGPGDGIVAVSEKLVDYLPGIQVRQNEKGQFESYKAKKSIGSFHRHYGNFAHKVRTLTYLRALGGEGVRKMSAVAVLSARYLLKELSRFAPTLPAGAEQTERMHEFILTLSKEAFDKAQAAGVSKSQVIPMVGKLFLDFGLHAPTVAFPEVYGLMVEPTESFSKDELDRFVDVVESIYKMVHENPEVLSTAPHFCPIEKIDEVAANKDLILSTEGLILPELPQDEVDPRELSNLATSDICEKIIKAHHERG